MKATPKKKTSSKKKTGKKQTPKKIAKASPKKSAKSGVGKSAATGETKKAAKQTTKKKKKGDTLMCFLTTACVHYYNMADDGYELSTLRAYRDTYLAKTNSGRTLIDQYYKLSPEIVSRIEGDENKSNTYAFILKCVLKACSEIDRQAFLKAKTTYKVMVQQLQRQYAVYLS